MKYTTYKLTSTDIFETRFSHETIIESNEIANWSSIRTSRSLQTGVYKWKRTSNRKERTLSYQHCKWGVINNMVYVLIYVYMCTYLSRQSNILSVQGRGFPIACVNQMELDYKLKGLYAPVSLACCPSIESS